MKRSFIFAFSILLLLVFSSCSFSARQKGGDPSSKTNASAEADSEQTTENSTATSSPGNTEQADETVQPSPTSQPPHILFDQLEKSLLNADSYRRKIKFVSTPPPTAGSAIDTTYDEAFIKSPFAAYMYGESVAFNSKSESLIINNTWYERRDKNEKWMKHDPGDFGYNSGPPPYSYSVSPMHYPINYEKLSPLYQGSENINGFECSKYTISGTYTEETTLYEGTEYENVVTIALSGEGTLWILEDNAIGQVMIRQRMTINRDIEDKKNLGFDGQPQHSIADEVIEDDILEINTVVIQAPSDADTIPYVAEEIPPMESQAPETQEPESNTSIGQFILAESRQTGPVTQKEAEQWTQYLWNTDQGYMVFEWINGYVVGFYASESREKIFEDQSQCCGTVTGKVLTGDLVILGDHGQFELTLDDTGKSFTGKWKFDVSTDLADWIGTVSE